MIDRHLRSLAVLTLLFAALMWAGLVLTPPPVRSSNSPTQFDAVAAQARLARILGDETPHPVDSAAQDVTRAALLAEIAALGFTSDVREEFACRPQPRGPLIDCALVRNIVFSIGPTRGPRILAATHYDSVSAAPGASDAGIGIAAWLEIARILSQEPLQRRITFLISDGEEPALLGAFALARSDADMSGIEALVNLEARGTRGPAIFFETNQPNADAVAAYASAPRPLANSVMADAYALMSNSTDVTALTRPGLDVVNIALLDGLEDYHTPQDSLASFNMASLQHMGDTALATVRSLAAGPDAGRETPMVYTDIASRVFVAMPVWAGQAALALSGLLAALAFWRAGGERRWRAIVAPALALALAGALSAVVALSLSAVRGGEPYWFAYPHYTRAWCALIALLGALVTLMFLRVRNAAQAATAGAAWFALVGLGLSLALPGISILFALSSAAFSAGVLLSFVWKRAIVVASVFAAVLTVLIWAPTLHLVELALGYDLPYATTMLIAIMLWPWLGALAAAQGDAPWRWPAAALGAAALAAIVFAVTAPASSAERPRPLNVLYFFNATTGEAHLLAGSALRRLPEEMASSAFEPLLALPGDLAPYWAMATEAAPAETPAIEELSTAVEGNARVVRGVMRMNGAYRVSVRLPRAAAPISVSINGVETRFADTGGQDSDFVTFACQGRACDGAPLLVTLNAEAPPQDWYLIGQTPGLLPPAARALADRRPPSATQIQFGDATLTLSSVRIE